MRCKNNALWQESMITNAVLLLWSLIVPAARVGIVSPVGLDGERDCLVSRIHMCMRSTPTARSGVPTPDTLSATGELTKEIMADWYFVIDHWTDSLLAHPEFHPPAIFNVFVGTYGHLWLKRYVRYYSADKYNFQDTSVDFTTFADTVPARTSGHNEEVYPVALQYVADPIFPVDSVVAAIAAVPMFVGVLHAVHWTPRRLAEVTAVLEQAHMAEVDYLIYGTRVLRRPLTPQSQLGKNVLFLWNEVGNEKEIRVLFLGYCEWYEVLNKHTKFRSCPTKRDRDVEALRTAGLIR